MKAVVRLDYPDGIGILVVKEEIERILFYRGDKLLLDEVKILNGKAIGRFTVTKDLCTGHEPMPGMPVMQGVLFIEMAFQLAGVLAAKYPDMFRFLIGKVPFARRNGEVEYPGFVKPGDVVEMETITQETSVSIRTTAVKIQSGEMIARVGNEDKCRVSSVTVVLVPKSAVNKQKS